MLDGEMLDRIRREARQLRPYRVRLPIYEGPMDLLLFLVSRRELDVYDVPLARITEEYMEYLVLMQVLDIEVAGDFLALAATLLVLKSRTLLPVDDTTQVETADEESEEGVDARAELQRRLMEYQRYRESAEELRLRIERQSLLHTREHGEAIGAAPETLPLEAVSIFDILSIFKQMLLRTTDRAPALLERQELTVGSRIAHIILAVRRCPDGITFRQTVSANATKLEVIVTFLAILELIGRRQIVVRQRSPMDEIRLHAGPELRADGT